MGEPGSVASATQLAATVARATVSGIIDALTDPRSGVRVDELPDELGPLVSEHVTDRVTTAVSEWRTLVHLERDLTDSN